MVIIHDMYNMCLPLQTIPLRLPRSSERLPVVKDAIHRRSPLGIMCLAAVQRCFSRLDSDNVLEGMNEDDGDKRCAVEPLGHLSIYLSIHPSMLALKPA